LSSIPSTENAQPINLAGDTTIGKLFIFLITLVLILNNCFACLQLQLGSFCQVQLDMIMLSGCESIIFLNRIPAWLK